MKKKIRIFDYCWHIPHQWDMINALKNDCEFFYCLNVKRHWDTSQRPLPMNISFVTHYQPGLYDVAILHLDQEIIKINHQKRLIYDHFNSTISDIPKIVINHGSPVFPEWFFASGYKLSESEMQIKCVEIIRQLIGKNVMVVNSFTSATQKEWGFGIPIVHGINSSDWYDLPKEPRVFTALSPLGFDTYYNRRCMGLVADELYNKYGYILQYARLNADVGNSFEEYKIFLGKSLLYLDTSFRTPMNRGRTEAFLSGCCVIQVKGAHDLECWAKPGENIVIVPDDPEKISNTIVNFLENNYERAIAIGKCGKEMAINEFNPERYRADWLKLLENTISKPTIRE